MVKKIIYLALVLSFLNSPVTLATNDVETNPEKPEGSGFEAYDGGWDFALGFELSKMSEFDAGDLGWGLIIGKDFYQNENISLGAQLHFSRSFLDDPDEDIAIRDSTNLFATSHFKGFPAIQFKLGTSYTKLETEFDNESESGVVFGIDIRLPTRDRNYFTMISYEDSVSGIDYRSLFFNFVILLVR